MAEASKHLGTGGKGSGHLAVWKESLGDSHELHAMVKINGGLQQSNIGCAAGGSDP